MRAVAVEKTLRDRIIEATAVSLHNRDLYTEQTVARVTDSLQRAEKDVKASLLYYANLGSLPEGKAINQASLRKLQQQIREHIRVVRDEHSLIMKTAVKDSYKAGIHNGIGDLVRAKMPFYRDLTPDGIKQCGSNIFTLIDKDALDFMVNYNVQLAGDVSRELTDGINRAIQTGIASGRSVPEIAKDIGRVVRDPEEFRKAGKTVFKTAQHRMELIARTETLRAHNQGHLKFYQTVGVQKAEWITAGDERMCRECSALDGKLFPVDKFPNQPLHPACRCSSVVAYPVEICGAKNLGATAAPAEAACILPPQAIEEMAKEKQSEAIKIGQYIANGEWSKLTIKQLQDKAKAGGISIARTKADFLGILKQKTGTDFSHLGGTELKSLLKEYKIAALRSKDELIDLLKAKAKHEEIPDFGSMPVSKLNELAKEKGISLNLTKQEVIDILDVLEPGVDHGALSGQSLIEAKTKFNLPILKTKEQLVKALENNFKEELGKKVTKEAVVQVAEETIKKEKEEIISLLDAVKVSADPKDYKAVLTAIKDAETLLGKEGLSVGDDYLKGKAADLAKKKAEFKAKIESMSAKDLKDLAKQSKVTKWQWGSKQEFITLFTETDDAAIKAAKDSIEAKWAKWAEKYGKKTAGVPAAKPVPKPTPKPAPAAVLEKPHADVATGFAKVDTDWDALDKGKAFKYSRDAKSLGGAHEKYIYVDERGDEWLFKPTDKFIAQGEEMAYHVARLVDPDAVEVRFIEIDGRAGSIQRLVKNVKSEASFRDIPIGKLSSSEIEAVQREHIIDWLISNHDAHAKQFVRAADGRVLGIDKGQTFKFLGKDNLSVAYHPNSMEAEPIYNTLFRAYKDGGIDIDFNAAFKYIRRVEQIPDSEYLEIIRPYVEGRFGAKASAAKDEFYRLALERKNNIRRDFEKFYDDLHKARFKAEFRFGDDVKTVRKLSKEDEMILREAHEMKAQGKAMRLDVDDIEDQNALVFTQKNLQGKEETVIQFKLRPDSEKKLLDALGEKGSAMKGLSPGETLPDDTFYDKILAGAKTVNHHVDAGDFAYNQDKLDEIRKIIPDLEKLAKSGKTASIRDMAEEYRKACEAVLDAANNNKKLAGKFEQYTAKKQLIQKEALPEPKKTGFRFQKTDIRMEQRQCRNGEVHVVKSDTDLNTIFGRGSGFNRGVQYRIELDDGVVMDYRPWDSANPYAVQGQVEIRVTGKIADPEKFESILDRLEQLGVNSVPASVEDAEIMMLSKQAYLLKKDTSPAWKKMMREMDSSNATKAERIQAMRKFWADELGVDDVTKIPGYDPVGNYELGFKDPTRRAGYRHQMRFDITDADLERELKGFGLYHNITDSGDVEDLVKTVLENNGNMVSTVEKIRIGVKPGGMSPVSDMRTGGATYFFTRVRKLPVSGRGSAGLYFKKRLLRRMDAITYDHDAFGKVIDDYVRKKRLSSIQDYKRLASGGRSDETIFKYTVSLPDEIEVIKTSNAAQRARIVEMFKKQGFSKLPDGRRIEDVVL
ncbi:MAG TPA: minor capsid protein [bacterium]|nr:minor capsid protein [bacterium]